jgi:hypothetical protein
VKGAHEPGEVVERGAERLDELFAGLAKGVVPEADGRIEVVPPDPAWPGLEAVVEFTAHAVVITSVPADDLVGWGVDAYGGAVAPDVVRRLAGPTGWVDAHDALLLGHGTGSAAGTAAGPLPALRDDVRHPRLDAARDLRHDVRAFGDERGFVTLGTRLGRQWELSIELAAGVTPGRGVGGTLLRDALAHLPAGAPVLACVSPGNARSLRCFLRAGFVPLGAEVLLHPAREAS